jgi:hypothetical protein
MPSSLNDLRTQILAAEPQLKYLDAEMEKIQFDPLDTHSVEAARESVNRVIATLLVGFKTTPILGPLAGELKCQYSEVIDEQLAVAQVSSIAI